MKNQPKALLFFMQNSFKIGFSGLLILLLSFSCNSSKEKNPIKGNWYGYEKDSTYFELYVNDSLMVLLYSEFGPLAYDYLIQEEILIVSNEVGMERLWKITLENDSSFNLSDSLETVKYKKLNIEKDFFVSIRDSIAFEGFKSSFFERVSKNEK